MPQCFQEEQRRQSLMSQLHEGLKCISQENLLNPVPGARPYVGIVANYPKVRQKVLDDLIGLALVTLLLSLAGGIYLDATMGSVEAIKTVINQLSNVKWSVPVIGLFLVALLIVLLLVYSLIWFTAFLLSRFFSQRDSLSLDLNGIYYASLLGRRFTPWRSVFGTECRRRGWIRLFLEDGGTITFRVPAKEQEWLIQIIRLLLHNHQTDFLGELDPGSHTSPTIAGTA